MSRPDSKTLENYLDYAIALAKLAGENTARYFHKNIEVETKADQSPVTQADRETESLCRKKIEQDWPSHGIIGEEYGESPDKGSSLVWTIDPIDGTKSFISGLPLYTVLLSLLYRGEPLLGVIHQPILGETAWGAAGLGAWYNGSPARLRACETLSSAWLLCTDPGHLLNERPGAAELLKQVKISRSWGDGYGYLMLASGRADVMIDPAMHLWDVAALVPVIREAGGLITDLEGKDGLGASTLAAGPGLHGQVLAHLKKT